MTATVDRCVFGILTAEDLAARSCAAVTSPVLLDEHGAPRPGGPFDARLGTTTRGVTCETCGREKADAGTDTCLGHPGTFALPVAVTNPVFVHHVVRWLRVVCHACGEFVGGPPPPHATLDQLPRGGVCRACNHAQPATRAAPDDSFTILAVPADAADGGPRFGAVDMVANKLYPAAILRILSRVPAGAPAQVREHTHPRHLVWDRVAPITPATTRPIVRRAAGATTTDVVTSLLERTLRTGLTPADLPDLASGATPTDDQARAIANIEMFMHTAVVGSGAETARRRTMMIAGAPVPGIMGELKRKFGHIRGNILGYRTVWGGRFTIYCDTSLDIDEVGISRDFARKVQVIETVTPYNLARLTRAYERGTGEYPGSTVLERRATGRQHDVSRMGRERFRLEVGDRLHRDLVDGDPVYISRPPALLVTAVISGRARVGAAGGVQAIGLNVLICRLMGADFDGDQVMIAVPHGVGAIAEATILGAVHRHLVSWHTGGANITLVLDSVAGAARLTTPGPRFDRVHAMRALGVHARLGGADQLTGSELLGRALQDTPVRFDGVPSSGAGTLGAHNRAAGVAACTVRGDVITGVLDMSSLGSTGRANILHTLSADYGTRVALGRVHALQQIAQRAGCDALTVGVADMDPGPAGRAAIDASVADVLAAADLIILRLRERAVVPPVGVTVRQHFENRMVNALTVDDAVVLGAIARHALPGNGMLLQVVAGSKGNSANVRQISGAVGLTLIDGRLMPRNFSPERTSAYNRRGGMAPKEIGFVQSCHITGTDAVGMQVQAMKGLRDLSKKAISTSKTGSRSRRTGLTLSSAVLDNLLRVVEGPGGAVLQILYGGDGLHPARVQVVRLPTLRLDDAGVRGFATAGLPAKDAGGAAARAAVARLLRDRDTFRAGAHARTAGSVRGEAPDEVLPVPVDVERMVRTAVDAVRAAGAETAHTGPALAAGVEAVEAACRALPGALTSWRGPVRPHIAGAVCPLAATMRAALRPAVLRGLPADAVQHLLEQVLARFRRALVPCGLGVGALAAQGISEPDTQSMLSSHTSTGGGPRKSAHRADELLSRRPEVDGSMLLKLRPGFDPDAVAGELAELRVRDLVGAADVLLERMTDLQYPEFAGDAAWVRRHVRARLADPPRNVGPWCFRLQILKTELVMKDVGVEALAVALAATGRYYVAHTTEGAEHVVVRAWALLGGAEMRDAGAAAELARIMDMLLRGVPGVVRAAAAEVVAWRPGPGGALVEARVAAVRTVGSNLAAALRHPAVDPAGARTSGVAETAALLGIVAARNLLVDELRSMLGGGAPSDRHLELMADKLTHTGRLGSIERAGMARSSEAGNMLLRMAYGAPTQVATAAALAGSVVPVRGVAAAQMVGRMPAVGSEFNQLVVDTAFVSEHAAPGLAEVLGSL